MDFITEIPGRAQNLKDGKLILYPTDTIWGIGCDATNETATRKINLLKKREEFLLNPIKQSTKLSDKNNDIKKNNNNTNSNSIEHTINSLPGKKQCWG